MRAYGRVLAASVLLGGLLICGHQARAANPITIDMPGGARITYGPVAGATTQQGFHNYILDQTVIRDIQDLNTHATVWNRTAEVWQKAFPDRIEQVPVQQYIQGRDF